MPALLVLSDPNDSLSIRVATKLSAQGIRTLRMNPGALGTSQISLRDDLLYINDRLIQGILFRASPDVKFSDGFEKNDQSFCDAEIRAVLLAALNLDSMIAVNKYDAVAWFEGVGWPTWRRKLVAAGIPVSEFFFGDFASRGAEIWYPYASRQQLPPPGSQTKRTLGSAITMDKPAQRSIIVKKDIVAGRPAPAIQATVELLDHLGVSLAEIETDDCDNILTVNTFPTISEPEMESVISDRIAEIFYAHLSNR